MSETNAPVEFSNSQVAKEIVAITLVTVAVTAATFATVGALTLAFEAVSEKLNDRRYAKKLAKQDKKH